jgi:hypothetical protein
MTKQLSPEAQAVLNAVKADLDNAPWAEDSTMIAALSTAAVALRAVAKQSIFADVSLNKTIEVVPVDILLDIANELEAQ